MSHEASSGLLGWLLQKDSFDSWNDNITNDSVVHPMLAVEISNLSEMPGKFLLTVHERITICKEAPTHGLVFTVDVVKYVLLHFLEMLDHFFGYCKESLTICRRLEVLKGAHLQDILHLRQMQSRIYADAQTSGHLHGVHSSHAGANHQVSVMGPTIILQEWQRLRWVDGNVRGNHVVFRHLLGQILRCTVWLLEP